MERKNNKTKSVGNGEGSLYYSETLNCWVFQYFFNNKRKTMKQRKKESVRDFKKRVTVTKNQLDNNTYIEKRNDTIEFIIKNHIEQKFKDGIVIDVTYKRDLETLKQLNRCCPDLMNMPIQKAKLHHIQTAKENMKKYKQNGINKMWRLLFKAFRIASSPSNMIIPYNIMDDENLKKPISDKITEKVKPLTSKEKEKLVSILDNEERNHKYRNIVKLQLITAMRIGEVLARSKNDIAEDKSTLRINNTLTKDKNGNTILGEHTKTYNKQTHIDTGIRYFPVTEDMLEILNEQIDQKITNIYGLLFWDYEKNTFITVKEINSWLRRLNEKYKITDNLPSHRLRHTTITFWKESGMDMNAIQYLAGHVEGSSVTNDVYIDVSSEFILDQFKKVI